MKIRNIWDIILIVRHRQQEILSCNRSADTLSKPENDHYAADKISERAERVADRQKNNKEEAEKVMELLKVRFICISGVHCT